MTRAHLRNILLAVALIAAFGWVRMPVEQRLEESLREAHFRAPALDITMRERLGQSTYVAAMGGFRSLIATWQAIQAFTSFERAEWTDVEDRYQLVTQLQPRVKEHWISAKWHMAYNAYAWYKREAELAESEWKAWQLDNIVAEGYLDRGKQFLLDGMRFLPDEPELFRDMGDLYAARDKYDNPCEAAEWYAQGMQMPDAHRALRALYLASLARCPEKKEEAYAAFRNAYFEGYITPTVRVNFERFEDADVDARIAGKSLEQVGAAARAEGAGYLGLAGLARYFTTVEHDREQAIAVLREIAAMDGAPDHYRKKLGLELAAIPGREDEALEILTGFYMPKLPGLYPEIRRAIVAIEDRLGVPDAQRIIPADRQLTPDAVW